MSFLPEAPVSPREFIEEVIPSLFAEVELDDEAEQVDLKVGVRLDGPEGGEWTLHFVEGELGIIDGLAPDCGLTILQSVADWRSAIWEARPGLVADGIREIAELGPAGLAEASRARGPGNPKALRELETLPGRIDAIVAGEGVPDWRIAVHIGPGPIAETPQATLMIGSVEAESLRVGELHPLEALITGKLRLEGDLGLILRLQAIAMAASMPAPGF